MIGCLAGEAGLGVPEMIRSSPKQAILRHDFHQQQTLHVSFVNGGKACGDAERDTFLTYFHDCNLDVIRGADWCRIKKSVIDGLYNKYTVRIGWPQDRRHIMK
eukprot:COSAG01_NODE_607_length_14866_cov_60.568633_9_plen_103_part_00